MFLAMTNKAKRLLYFCYIQKVRAKDLQRGLEEMPALLADLPPGFHLLVDLARLESMDPACATQIGKEMDLCDHLNSLSTGSAPACRGLPPARRVMHPQNA